MRAIKFRAWDESQKQMIADIQLGSVYSGDGFNPEWDIMQFIGLEDRNLAEIYEDDIIRTPHGVINLISFRNGAFGFGNPVTNPRAFLYFCDNPGLHKKVEVIGTRMENPELLTE